MKRVLLLAGLLATLVASSMPAFATTKCADGNLKTPTGIHHKSPACK
jgi:hypothetical protein